MKGVIYFDGVCNLCNGFVSLMIKIDRKAKFTFAPIQGKTAKENQLEFSELKEGEQSIVYIDSKNNKYQRSNAVIQILNDLFFFGFIFQVFKLIPTKFRDMIYSFVAKNRYRIFGKKSSCRLPSSEERERFLD
jgi:predicted DCC family thiol-disulfide oxidoreductase YuxK